MGEVLLRGISKQGVYPLQPILVATESIVPALLATKESGDFWHARLSHTSSRVLGSLCSYKLISCTSKFHDDCVGCKLGKIHQLPFELVEHVSPYLLYKIHSDLWQSLVLFNQLYRYYVVFVDDFSRYSWIYPLYHKSIVHSQFLVFQKMVENLFNCKIKIFQHDGGRDWNLIIPLFFTIFVTMVLFFRSLVPILKLKMVLRKVNIVMLLKWLEL